MRVWINHKSRKIHGVIDGDWAHTFCGILQGYAEDFRSDEQLIELQTAGYTVCKTCDKTAVKHLPSCNLFAEDNYNAMYDALTDAALQWCEDNNIDTTNEQRPQYLFMQDCPRTNFVIRLVDALENRGYFIGS
jgi:hypothetical protein